jgi:aminopeptidase N
MASRNTNKFNLITACLVLAVLLIGCETRKKVIIPNNKVILDTIKVKKVQSTSIYKSTPQQKVNIPTCALYVNFNWEQHELLGTEIMEIKPYGIQPLDSLHLDAKSMEIYNVKQDGLTCSFKSTKTTLEIQLPRSVSPGQSSFLSIQYKAMPDARVSGGSRAISSDKGLYFTNTNRKDVFKPTQIFTQGETESNSCWFPTIDKPNNKSIYTLHITVPDSFTSLSNGTLIAQKDSGNYRIDTWQSKLPMSAYLVMMCIGEYSMVKDNLNKLPVNYYVEPLYEKNAKQIFANTPAMIEYFGNILGVPYPWEKYSQITARDYVSGAMENTSASLFGEFVQKTERELLDNSNDGIVAHELFHQWFGDLVTCESWSHLTLNEGFATFGEHLWLEKSASVEEQELLQYNDLNAYLNFAETFDSPLINFYYGDKEDMFSRITYKKGGRVLHLLRSELGAETFFAGIKYYLTTHAFGSVEVDDLRLAMEKVSGKDLRPFFNQWFLRGSHPNIAFSYARPDSNILQISYKQQNDSTHYIFDLPIQFKCVQNGKSVTQDFRINKNEGELLMDITKLGITDLKSFPIIIADANHTLIGKFTENKSAAEHKRLFTNTGSYTDKMRALNAAYKQGYSKTTDEIFYASLQDPLKHIRNAGLESIEMDSISEKEKLKGYLFNIANTETYKPNLALALYHLAYYKDSSYKSIFIRNTLDSNYGVAANALYALDKIDSTQALEIAEQLLKTTNVRSRLKVEIARLSAKTGKEKYAEFLENAIPTSFGRERVSLTNQMYNWTINNNTDAGYNKLIDILEYYATWDEVDAIKINATTQLNNMIKYLETENGLLKNINKNNLINTIKNKLTTIYAQEKEESILKAYRKKTWIK